MCSLIVVKGDQKDGCIAGQANVSDDAQEAPPAYEERTPGVGGWRCVYMLDYDRRSGVDRLTRWCHRSFLKANR
ncbi:uncharacterized protein OCT59_002987 [Rhizophagus irregularis]|uniref:Uncharacterized protein n=1 Tax=Rhizophagus irregularis TaxID=588596 RepID=A0A915ZMB1_9GLOM|nr:hypothetical protein OCT59_002987 [Rhizophagus irregularis]GET63575.1 hypothetical protein RIR_jg28985.t1 [Rhizophagus irregularis DAOM 181602=DAOM 197198]CAB4390466.1 unnamed protein product [Rhizophagus irregularis]CAB4481392.1 unnamed protein product [Rhizophagus irregularis]CAB5370642.1 unnamed protein product [Rhizophagus irregularis]